MNININKLLLVYNKTHEIPEKMIYKQSALNQIHFVRDILCNTLLRIPCFVLSTHTSKSIELPVYSFMMRNGVKVVMRGNFHDWLVSVKMPGRISNDVFFPDDVFSHERVSSIYSRYMGDDWIFDSWKDDRSMTEFTTEISGENDYALYMLMYFLNKMFPEMEVTDDELAGMKVEDVEDLMYRIYDVNGFNELNMDGWVIMEHLHHKVRSSVMTKDYDILKAMNLSNDLTRYPEMICSDTEVKKEFILYSRMFLEKF